MAYTPSAVEESLSSTIILPALSTFIPALDRPRLAVAALRPVDNNNYTLDTHIFSPVAKSTVSHWSYNINT